MRRSFPAIATAFLAVAVMVGCIPTAPAHAPAKPAPKPVAKPVATKPTLPAIPHAPTALAMSYVTTMVIDSAHQRVWLAGDNKVVVVDFAGKIVRTILVPGVDGMALQASKQRIYVTQPRLNLVRVIDSVSYATRPFAKTPGVIPQYLAVAKDRLWVSYAAVHATVGVSQIGVINPGSNTPQFQPLAVSTSEFPAYAPRLAAAGEHRAEIALGYSDYDSSTISTYLASDSALAFHGTTKGYLGGGSALSAMQLSADGKYVIEAPAGYALLIRYRFSDLAQDGSYLIDKTPLGTGCSGTPATGAAITADGRYVVGGFSVGWFKSTSSHLLRPAQVLPGCLAAYGGIQASDDGRRTFAISLGAGGNGLVLNIATGPEDPAAAPATPRTGLALDHADYMLVDAALSRIFVSPGTPGSEISVLNLSGKLIGQIPQMWGASQMALSSDGKTLYAALHLADAIASIDASTLKVNWLHPTGSNDTQAVVIAAGRLWSYAAVPSTAPPELASTDLKNPSAPWVVASGYTQGFQSNQLLSPSTTADSLLVVGNPQDSGATMSTTLYRIHNGTALTKVANRALGQSVAYSSDGSLIYASNLNHATSYSADDLSVAYIYDSGPRSASAITATRDGHVIVGEGIGNVYQFAPNTAYEGSLLAGPDEPLEVDSRGLAVSPDDRKVYVIRSWFSNGVDTVNPVLSIVPRR